MSSFKDLRIVDNFYQTSLFFPMPVVLISTCSSSLEGLDELEESPQAAKNRATTRENRIFRILFTTAPESKIKP